MFASKEAGDIIRFLIIHNSNNVGNVREPEPGRVVASLRKVSHDEKRPLGKCGIFFRVGTDHLGIHLVGDPFGIGGDFSVHVASVFTTFESVAFGREHALHDGFEAAATGFQNDGIAFFWLAFVDFDLLSGFENAAHRRSPYHVRTGFFVRASRFLKNFGIRKKPNSPCRRAKCRSGEERQCDVNFRLFLGHLFAAVDFVRRSARARGEIRGSEGSSVIPAALRGPSVAVYGIGR